MSGAQRVVHESLLVMRYESMKRPILRDDLDVDLALVLHSRCFGNCSQCICDPSLFADDLTKVAGGHTDFIGSSFFLRNFRDVHLIRFIYEGFDQILDEVFQRLAPFLLVLLRVPFDVRATQRIPVK